MSRKDDSKAKDAIVTVNIDDFTRTRDAVIVSLATLQSAVSDLSRAYINHANTVLNRGAYTLDTGVLSSGITSGITSSLLENGLLGGAPRHGSPGAKSEVGEKKRRKRAPHDPNAPKRALTPYFLYMQHNRAQIAQELGPNAKPKDVADEGTRRWAEMPESQKEVWKKLYADNLAVYKEKMKAYKAGLPIPDDDSAKAASQLQQSVDQADASGEESDEEDESSPEPEKEPTPPRSGKRRRATGDAKSINKDVTSPVSAKKGSPEKKKQQQQQQQQQQKAGAPKKDEPGSARKSLGGAADSKRSKKKRKSEVEAEE
ncbi:hypothetical protein VTN77DRAFT_4252 [Rasamsonia byssochlamydoides]|uniref:uncharacterized protein n=1 Tax=Rasamsonia byssochlamydoides TaxID=89139 RepID=UPI00374467CB